MEFKDNLDINWFPGHMAKAHRTIQENLKLVDVVIELLDARIPFSSANPLVNQVVQGKPRVVALNKADLAEQKATKQWTEYFQAQGLEVVAIEASSGKGAKTLVNRVERVASGKIQAMVAKGLRPRAVRAMVLGIPNVGKSSLINRLLGTATVRTGDKPGVTRGKQWIKIGKNLELLDTPGVLWPKLDNQEVGFRLAVTGAISDDVYDLDKVMSRLLSLMRDNYADRLINRYKLEPPLPVDNNDLLAQIGQRRGCLRAGGVVDVDKARRIILNEFRSGKLGVFTLDSVDERSED